VFVSGDGGQDVLRQSSQKWLIAENSTQQTTQYRKSDW
jgi:hypothetical protein